MNRPVPSVPSVPRSTPPAAARLLRPLRAQDVPAVLSIERRAYPFPWSEGIFRDCLRAGHLCWRLLQHEALIGYGILSVGADEAHLLNLCIAPDVQGHGHGRWLLRALIERARPRAQRMFLEVRASNRHAMALYDSEGFNEIGRRPRYYPTLNGREDAIVMAMELLQGV